MLRENGRLSPRCLLARPWGIFLFLMAFGLSYWKLKNRRGWKHCCAFNTTKCRVQQFLDKWMEHVSIQEKKEKWKKAWNEWFTAVMHMNDSLTRQEWILKIQTGRTLPETTSILKNTRQGLCQWSPSSRRSQPKHEAGDGLSFMEHVGFPRNRFAILAAAISQLEQLKSNSSVVVNCCYCIGVIMAAARRLLSLINTGVKYRYIFSFDLLSLSNHLFTWL